MAVVVRSTTRAAIVLFLVLTTIFVVGYVIGDPARLIVPIGSSAQEYETARESLGLNDPFGAQFQRFLGSVLGADLGDSYWLRRPAVGAVVERLPATLQLVAVSFLLAAVVGVALGLTAARHRGGLVDRGLQVLGTVLASLPNFWVGLVLIMVFAVRLGWFPTSGQSGPRSIVLPAVTLSLIGAGRIAQTVRAALVDEFSQIYVQTAYYNGLTPGQILRRHVGRNAAIPIITYLGWELTRLLTGAALVIELVFAWPGIGWISVEAVRHHDFPLIQASVVGIALLVVIVHTFVDVLYRVADPRVDAGART